MEFLRTCNTNAQAIGDFEAIAYQAFSISRTTSLPTKTRDWSAADDIRAVEAHLRRDLYLVFRDASRPWLWLFKPTTAEKSSNSTVELPQVDGYRLHGEQAGCIKALELARPPMRTGNINTASSSVASPATGGPHKSLQTGGARLPPGHNQANAPDQPQTTDCFVLYELFTSSVIALISYHLVKDCSATALNFRTFVSRPPAWQYGKQTERDSSTYLHWLTCVNAHWTSSGTLVILTTTERHTGLRCLDDVSSADEQQQLVGSCIRVAPRGFLARITNFDGPAELTDDNSQRQKKRARITSLEQSIAKWKSAVTRWLGWRGYDIPDLQKKDAWVRIRIAHMTSAASSSPVTIGQDRDILWPRALCFLQAMVPTELDLENPCTGSLAQPWNNLLRWFETSDSIGFCDPLDVAQDWALSKPERDRALEARRKAKKAEDEAQRRKEEQSSHLVSSPLNARGGTYGDLQAVSGVYPTPPDGVAPGTAISYGDTPSVSGTASNIILAPGATNPGINLSGPQEHFQTDSQQQLQKSPSFLPVSDNFNMPGGNDDLFGDMEDDGYEANDIDEADFDFFDAPDDEDVDMLDAPDLPESKTVLDADVQPETSALVPDTHSKEEISDPFAALENALATASQPATRAEAQKFENADSGIRDASVAQEQALVALGKDGSAEAHQAESLKREPTPPLSPSLIAKTLQPSPPTKATSSDQHEWLAQPKPETSFDPLSFNRRMSLVDAKYQDGRFGLHRHIEVKDGARLIPGPSQMKSLRDIPLLTKLRYATGVASATKIPEITALARVVSDDSDSDSASEASDLSEVESDEDNDAPPINFMGNLVLPTKRKLPTEANGTPMSVTSFAESLTGDWHDLHLLQLDETHLNLFEPSSCDWSLISLPSPAERPLLGSRFTMPALPSTAQMPDTPTSQSDHNWEPQDEKAMTGKERISVVQIVTDQIVSATLDLLEEDSVLEAKPGRSSSTEAKWHSTIKNIFPTAVDCDFPALAGVHEVFPDLPAHAKGQQRPPPPRQSSEGPALTKSQMYPIQAPYFRVRRAETRWDLLPPALAFWEPLGLSPISPPKNVVAFCVFPQSESLRPYLENFLLNIQLAYDSCKFGTHSRVETVVEFEGGLVPWKIDSSSSLKEVFTSLREVCVQLGKLLAIQHMKIREQQDSKIDAFVIYMIDPVGGSSGLWELCSSFWALFQAYGQSVPGRPDQSQKPDLVLQVIPVKYIASFDVPTMLDPSTYINLAREVYDRCPPSAPSDDKTSLGIYTAPAFQLEEILPRTIPFKLISEPPQDLVREGSYLHIGYAISLDGTWLTAAWTDNCGKSQAVVTYHLGTRAFSEIAKEIWQTTIEIAQARRVQWRISIAKAGAMERDELEAWVQLITCPTNLTLFITLVTVDMDPFLKLSPVAGPSSTTVAPANTPGSTPQPGVSPDPSAGLTPAATPSADAAIEPSADPETRLIDVTDETWGVILAHRLHNSNSTNQFSPAVVSGVLVKRGETFATSSSTAHPIPDPEAGPVILGVNILWIGAVSSTRAATSPFPPTGGADSVPPSPGEGPRTTTSLMWTPTPQSRATAETLLKEALGQYRALGLLAKLRGMRGTRHGTVPWHIAAAMRGVKGLGKVMGGL